MSSPTRPRSRPARNRLVRPLGWWLALVLIGVLGGFAGVNPVARVVGHLGLACAMVVCVFLPVDTLARRGGGALRWVAAGACLLAAMAVGLLPMPASVGRLLSPGWTEDRGAVAWDWLSLEPEATVTALSGTLLPLGMAFATAIWAAARVRRTPMEIALVTGAGLIAVVAAAHVGAGAHELFGTWPSNLQDRPFFAPFVNANHFGAALLLAYPHLLQGALVRDGIERFGYAIGTVAVLAVTVWASAAGPLLVLAGQSVVVFAWYRGWAVWKALFAVGPPSVLVIGGFLLSDLWYGDGNQASLHGRLPVWLASLRMFVDHWAFGTGAGTYGGSVDPYRRDLDLHSWTHAHNDWLEWATDTGMVGLLALGLALALLLVRRRSEVPPDAERGRPIMLGVVGVLVHCLVDFPLHAPGIAMATAALAAWWTISYLPAHAGPAWLVRGVAVVLAGLHLVGAAWEARTGAADAARDALASSVDGPEAKSAVDRLRVLAPHAWEIAFFDAREQALQGDREGAGAAVTRAVGSPGAYAYRNPRALRAYAQMLVLLDKPEDAEDLAERLVRRAPFDRRNWVVRAQILETTHPESAPDAWADALRTNGPRLLPRCWESVPVGVFWVDAVSDQDAALQLAVARFVLEQGDHDAALLGFESAMHTDPDVRPPEYGEALAKTERYDEAVAFLTDALRRTPGDAALIRRIAEIEERRGNWPVALSLWLSIDDPDTVAALRLLAAARQVEGPERAHARLKVMELDGLRGPQLVLFRASLERDLGRDTECRQTISGSGLLDDKRHRREARKLLERCGRPVSAPNPGSTPTAPEDGGSNPRTPP